MLGSNTKSYYGEGLAIDSQAGGDASVDLLTMLVFINSLFTIHPYKPEAVLGFSLQKALRMRWVQTALWLHAASWRHWRTETDVSG